MNEHESASRTDIRNHIVAVAIKAFHEEGIKSVTMDEIAHRLSISKRTLYQLFEDKEELLLTCVSAVTRKEMERMEKLADSTDNVLELLLRDFEVKLTEFKHVSHLFYDEMTKYPRIAAFIEQQRKTHARKAVDFLQRGVAQGLFLPGINFEIVYNIVSRQLEYAAGHDFLRKYSPLELFLNYVFLYFRGCTTQKGAAMMDAFLKKYREETGQA